MHAIVKIKHNRLFTPVFSLLSFFMPLVLLLSASSLAAPPSIYEAEYDARFRGFRARATMSLEALADETFRLNSIVNLRILGKSISSINEQGLFVWKDEMVKPLTYQFVQKGLGKRSRSIEYDWPGSLANTVVNDNEQELALSQVTFDELSLYTEIKRQLSAEVDNIYIDVIDENVVKQYHYRVVSEEQLETPLGLFNAVKIERIREPDSKRVTELWLAKDWEYLLLKLYQEDSKGKVFQINLREASLAEQTITPLNE
jgi:hypothetical protein